MGAAALVPLCALAASCGARGTVFREVTFCAQVAYLRAICSELDVHFQPESVQAPLGSPRCPKWLQGAPREPKGSQSDAKESSLGAQGAPQAPKRRRKVAPRSKMRSQSHPKETNKTQSYIHMNKIHANSRSTAIQRPTSK